MSNYVPLRDRDDLPDEVRRILGVRRHVANPWTEEDALVIARWRGYEPTEPWPGSVGVAWPGICVLGHPCKPHFGQIIAGRPPCQKSGHIKENAGVRKSPKGLSTRERAAQTRERVMRIAQERGDVIRAIESRSAPSGVVANFRKTYLTIEYAGCGHVTPPLAIPADSYIARGGSGCGVCNPSKLVPGVNELFRIRPDLVDDMVDPSLASTLTHGSWVKVMWRCSLCDNEWKAAVASRTQLGSGCPRCNGAGYNKAAPGTLYVVQGSSATTGEVLIKVGVSNTPHDRLRIHAKQGLGLLLASLTWSDGMVPLDVERRWVVEVRKHLPKHLKPTKDDLLDGYREAVIDTDESRLAIHAFLLEAQATAVETLTEKMFDPEIFLPRVR